MVKLAENRYGKSRVRLVKVRRGDTTPRGELQVAGSRARGWVGWLAVCFNDRPLRGQGPSERLGVGRGDYLITTFLLSAAAAFGTRTVRIPS